MDLTQTVLVFADARIGTPFLLALSLGLVLASGIFLLRPWPPRLVRGVMFAIVVAVCGAAIGYALLDRKVVIDSSKQSVRQSFHVLGIGRDENWSFRDFDAARVEHRPIRVQRGESTTRSKPTDYEMHDNYVVELLGRDAQVYLQSYEDAREAERIAVGVARAGQWRALRRGYRLRTGSGKAEDGLTVGDLQTFETPAGQRGIGVSIESWTRIQIEDGAESVIEPAVR